ncbi:hypothetical protein G3O00_30230 [Burkholderia sp. Ac-20384]|uniref:hypothetical protein n=1 Tax=Burkholderia sp. Ac-20384 TaxID=2703902 RepID=UPI001981A591|nr:hypothetical protein [Burkholderia sp. Ac-20384]MBN3827870.1 hypothetical protein [Burkholderia sp. Ac-20384]
MVVYFGVDQGLLAVNGTRIPAAGTELLEMDHASNGEHRQELRAQPRGELTNAKEEPVIKGFEAEAQRTHSRLPRDAHKPVGAYTTDGVISISAKNADVEEMIVAQQPEFERLTESGG